MAGDRSKKIFTFFMVIIFIVAAFVTYILVFGDNEKLGKATLKINYGKYNTVTGLEGEDEEFDTIIVNKICSVGELIRLSDFAGYGSMNYEEARPGFDFDYYYYIDESGVECAFEKNYFNILEDVTIYAKYKPKLIKVFVYEYVDSEGNWVDNPEDFIEIIPQNPAEYELYGYFVRGDKSGFEYTDNTGKNARQIVIPNNYLPTNDDYKKMKISVDGVQQPKYFYSYVDGWIGNFGKGYDIHKIKSIYDDERHCYSISLAPEDVILEANWKDYDIKIQIQDDQTLEDGITFVNGSNLKLEPISDSPYIVENSFKDNLYENSNVFEAPSFRVPKKSLVPLQNNPLIAINGENIAFNTKKSINLNLNNFLQDVRGGVDYSNKEITKYLIGWYYYKTDENGNITSQKEYIYFNNYLDKYNSMKDNERFEGFDINNLFLNYNMCLKENSGDLTYYLLKLYPVWENQRISVTYEVKNHETPNTSNLLPLYARIDEFKVIDKVLINGGNYYFSGWQINDESKQYLVDLNNESSVYQNPLKSSEFIYKDKDNKFLILLNDETTLSAVWSVKVQLINTEKITENSYYYMGEFSENKEFNLDVIAEKSGAVYESEDYYKFGDYTLSGWAKIEYGTNLINNEEPNTEDYCTIELTQNDFNNNNKDLTLYALVIGGIGTEKNPFRITNVNDWNNAVHSYATASEFIDKNGDSKIIQYHFAQTNDITVTSVDNLKKITLFKGAYFGAETTLLNDEKLEYTKTAKQIMFNVSRDYSLFEELQNASISNIDVVTAVNVSFTTAVFASTSDSSIVQDCSFNGKIENNSHNTFGGLINIIYASNILNCKTEGTIENKYNTINFGGLVGGLSGTVENCEVNSQITSIENVTNFGGFVGSMDNYNETHANIKSCTFSKEIQILKDTTNFGGLVGKMSNNSTAENCVFSGNLNTNYKMTYAGGITGKIEYNSIIKNCINSGSITFYTDTELNVGGFAGMANNSEILNSKYSGSIVVTVNSTSTSVYLGGFVAIAENIGIIDCNSELGEINLNDNKSITASTDRNTLYVGGFIGKGLASNIDINDNTNCVSNCNITVGDVEFLGKAYIGGFIGYEEISTINNYIGLINDCEIKFNNKHNINGNGNVYSESWIGGIMGYANSLYNTNINFIDCVSGEESLINVNTDAEDLHMYYYGKSFVGGIVGYFNQLSSTPTLTVKNSCNNTDIKVRNTIFNIGGLFGYLSIKTHVFNDNKTPSNTANIECNSYSGVPTDTYIYVSNLIAQTTKVTMFENVVNNGNVKFENYLRIKRTYVAGFLAKLAINPSPSLKTVDEVNFKDVDKVFDGDIDNMDVFQTIFINCENNSIIDILKTNQPSSDTTYNYIGGFIGENNGIVYMQNCSLGAEDNYNKINIDRHNSNDGENLYVGGMVGTVKYLKNINTDIINNYINVSINAKITSTLCFSNYLGCVEKILILKNVDIDGTLNSNLEFISTMGVRGIGGIIGVAEEIKIYNNVTNVNFDIANKTNYGYALGGIIGTVNDLHMANCKTKENSSIKITNPSNSSTVEFNVGGLVGSAEIKNNKSFNITNDCVNNANMQIQTNTTSSIGGVVGKLKIYNTALIENDNELINCGNIEITNVARRFTHVGGCIGYIESEGNQTLQNFKNFGLIKNFAQTGNMSETYCSFGGIVGRIVMLSGELELKDLVNYNSIDVKYKSGVYEGSISSVGGIVGHIASSISSNYASKVILTNCKNIKDEDNYISVTSTASSLSTNSFAVGGIIGYADSNVSIIVGNAENGISCENSMNITLNNGNSKGYVGGIIGCALNYINANIKYLYILNCSNTGQLEIYSAKTSYVGGIIGRSTSVGIINCKNTGKIASKINTNNSILSYIGGVIGLALNDLNINNSYATNNFDLSSNSNIIGGLAGKVFGSTIIEDCYYDSIMHTALNNNAIFGGIIGEVNSNIIYYTKIYYSYADVKITNNIGVSGGLIGRVTQNIYQTISGSKVEISGVEKEIDALKVKLYHAYWLNSLGSAIGNFNINTYGTNFENNNIWNEFNSSVLNGEQIWEINNGKPTLNYICSSYNDGEENISVKAILESNNSDNVVEENEIQILAYSKITLSDISDENTRFLGWSLTNINTFENIVYLSGDTLIATKNLTLYPVTSSDLANGEGSEDNPYQISNINEWNNLILFYSKNPNVFYKQTADLIFKSDESIQAVNFAATYDGNGKTITLSGTHENPAIAPFYEISGTVKNLNIKIDSDNNYMQTQILDKESPLNCLSYLCILLNGGKIENCTLRDEDELMVKIEEETIIDSFGGFVSCVVNGKIENCTIDSSKLGLSIENDCSIINFGGFVGFVYGEKYDSDYLNISNYTSNSFYVFYNNKLNDKRYYNLEILNSKIFNSENNYLTLQISDNIQITNLSGMVAENQGNLKVVNAIINMKIEVYATTYFGTVLAKSQSDNQTLDVNFKSFAYIENCIARTANNGTKSENKINVYKVAGGLIGLSTISYITNCKNESDYEFIPKITNASSSYNYFYFGGVVGSFQNPEKSTTSNYSSIIRNCENCGELEIGDSGTLINDYCYYISSLGGVVGLTIDVSVINALNSGKINVKETTSNRQLINYMGGIIAQSVNRCFVFNSVNYGEIDFSKTVPLAAGGIIGFWDCINGYTHYHQITNQCINYAKISGKISDRLLNSDDISIGGIIGYVNSWKAGTMTYKLEDGSTENVENAVSSDYNKNRIYIENCYNQGELNITLDTNKEICIGGIFGKFKNSTQSNWNKLYSFNNVEMKNVYNSGNIKITSANNTKYIGNLMGYVSIANISLYYCATFQNTYREGLSSKSLYIISCFDNPIYNYNDSSNGTKVFKNIYTQIQNTVYYKKTTETFQYNGSDLYYESPYCKREINVKNCNLYNLSYNNVSASLLGNCGIKNDGNNSTNKLTNLTNWSEEYWDWYNDTPRYKLEEKAFIYKGYFSQNGELYKSLDKMYISADGHISSEIKDANDSDSNSYESNWTWNAGVFNLSSFSDWN